MQKAVLTLLMTASMATVAALAAPTEATEMNARQAAGNLMPIPHFVAKPNPAKAVGGLTAAEMEAREREKARLNPMTRNDPRAPSGWHQPGAWMAYGSGDSDSREGRTPASKDERWGTNTTVMNQSLASTSPPGRTISIDSDSAGNFYALVGLYSGSHPLKLYRSDDDGQTWDLWWDISIPGPAANSKLIVVDKDSLFFYCFYVDTSGQAGVWRLNNDDIYASTQYILRADSALAIAAAWDLDRTAPWFHVAIEKEGPQNVQGVEYVRGSNQGKVWTAPDMVFLNGTCPSIATGNVGYSNNNVFMAYVWKPDSAAYVSYDSSSIWRYQKIGGYVNRKEEHAQVAASHGEGADSVRVWLSYTHWDGGFDQDIWYSYNKQNAKGAWVKDNYAPGAAATNWASWGSSLNVPNWKSSGSINAMVELAFYSDSGSTYQVVQSYMIGGWEDPTNWSDTALVNDHDHSLSTLPYATRARRSNGYLNSVALYPGWGPQNVYFNGFWVTGVAGEPGGEARVNFALMPNFPNPVKGRTNFSFSLPRAGDYTLRVYNVAGQAVKTFTGRGQAGPNSVAWNAGKNGAGVYFYQLSAGGQSATRKLVVVK